MGVKYKLLGAFLFIHIFTDFLLHGVHAHRSHGVSNRSVWCSETRVPMHGSGFGEVFLILDHLGEFTRNAPNLGARDRNSYYKKNRE